MPVRRFLILALGIAPAALRAASVIPVGAMKDVMRGGRLEARLDLDTLPDRKHLCGLGPADSLRGELLILDGKAYRSSVLPDGGIRVEETFASKAPFFVYARVRKWETLALPDSLLTLSALEALLDRGTRSRERPFAFRLAGKVRSAGIHVVNLPPGAAVRSLADAHRGQKDIELADATVDMVGFFSTRHQGVFIHHDSFLHIHLITADRKVMGHLDRVELRGGEVKLFMAAEEGTVE